MMMEFGHTNGGWNDSSWWESSAEFFKKERVEPFEDPYVHQKTEGLVWRPKTDVYEDDLGYTIVMEIPGFEKELVKITIRNQVLKVSGQRIEEAHEDMAIHQRESHLGAFERAFQLPDDVDERKVKAELEDGILTIRLPKLDNRRPRKIEVR